MLADVAWSVGGVGLYLAGMEYDAAPWWAGWILGVLAILVPFAKWVIEKVLKAKNKNRKE
ncbi:MAG: hypothetical protein GQ553_01830 [Nitrosomonadaceae bacterium]|nr:hypothetical protein [Nitrosomonadaceae bacterium]